MFRLKEVFVLIYFIVSLFHFYNFEPENNVIYGLFTLNFCIITFLFFYHLYLEKGYSPFLSTFLVFNYLFFLVAPMSQITTLAAMDDPVFVHKFPYQEDLVIHTLWLIALFNTVFSILYVAFSSRFTSKRIVGELKNRTARRTTPYMIVIWLVLTLLILVTQFQFVIDELNRPSWQSHDVSVIEGLVKTKILFVFPLVGIIITVKALRAAGKLSNKMIYYMALACFFLLLLFFKNPLATKRHELGPIFFILIFLFIPRLITSNLKTTAMIFLAMLVGFPLAQLLTHIDYPLEDIVQDPSLLLSGIEEGVLTKGYYSLNYDAFMNIGVVIEHVANKGFSYGYQMLSGLLFFVPRAIWPSKPPSSGLIVGNTLKDNYGFTFTNLSNPFVSEAYDNFGHIGMVIFAFLLVITMMYFRKWLLSGQLLKQCMAIYFALHLLMLLRGDFTNGIAYLGGALFSMYLLPKSMEQVLDMIIYSRKKNATK
ncbi:O-antigen polysaccharide polymerase Wzy [Nonlabens ponticola]|uniref:O-antigen polysaccharide polymerase Wzy n=1 Tax=Nonlabens ponticola TaxID=2496866 RepID=A0A3S9MVB1_9FLAO|nr:O-antigen polysaccharide polymerase Wzy [Nonlabens ponticola]AZQ43122.1 O-antigen polysaccharide polymerase Wzy [Nonlabens ponticola]